MSGRKMQFCWYVRPESAAIVYIYTMYLSNTSNTWPINPSRLTAEIIVTVALALTLTLTLTLPFPIQRANVRPSTYRHITSP